MKNVSNPFCKVECNTPWYEIDNSTPRSYDDHTLFWSLKYRGELRKKVLVYARERDLLHPEDIGTMTHWYSRTPHEYLDKVKPDFMPQTTGGYSEESGLVWDIRQEKNLDAYWKLTEAHIREYGSPDIFHTIGLAERRCYSDRESNQQMKLYTYRRIQKELREHYPNAPLLIASWDFCMYWEPEEVRELLKELDPDRTVIFDYTSDNDDESRNFLNWGVIGQFPWVFGIFQSFEPDTEPRANYEVIARRLRTAAGDPMCRGFILWPENSHADTLMIEFCAANSWDPEKGNREIGSFIERFCAARYSEEKRGQMLAFWRDALPLITAEYWHGPGLRRQANCLCQGKVIFLASRFLMLFNAGKTYLRAQYALMTLGPVQAAGAGLLRRFAELNIPKEDEFIRRDVFDLIRTVGSRGLSFLFDRLALAIHEWQTGKDNAAGRSVSMNFGLAMCCSPPSWPRRTSFRCMLRSATCSGNTAPIRNSNIPSKAIRKTATAAAISRSFSRRSISLNWMSAARSGARPAGAENA